MKRALTRTERVNEILKCGKDPKHFINTYVKIQTLQFGRILFNTFDFQDDIIDALDDPIQRFLIVLKARQLGLTTITAAYALHQALFYKDKNILCIATKLETAQNFIKKVKVALQELPPWLVLPKYDSNKCAIVFDNGSEIKAVPTSDTAGRTESVSLLIVDEAAFIRNFDEIWTGIYPTISTGGECIVLSTPNGVGGQYYRLWTQAVAGQNEFTTFELPWWMHPDHDEEWFKKETRAFTRRKVAQEYLCDFIASGDTFLEPDDLGYLKDLIREPIEKLGFDRNVWIWKRPQSGHQYVLSADVARGDAADYSTFHIIDYEECEIVAEYMGKVPPEKLAPMIDEYGRMYNEALVIPENNTFGYFACVKLRDDGYPRLYYEKNRGDPMAFFTPPDMDMLPGFNTNVKTRVQILSKLGELIRTKQLKSYSHRLHDQLQAFIWQGAKPMAQKDSHDDLIMSAAIGAWIVGGAHGISEQAMAMSMAILKSTTLDRRDQSSLPRDVNSVKPLVNPMITGYNPRNVAKPRDPSQVHHTDVSDFSWLLG